MLGRLRPGSDHGTQEESSYSNWEHSKKLKVTVYAWKSIETEVSNKHPEKG